MIELKHLRTLQALRHTGSLAAAAAQLHQTQSALSHQFSDLEQRLGFRLFVRKSQPLRFTPQGEILLQLAEQILPQIQQALQACHEPHQTTLRIAIECHSCIQWLTPALNNFRQSWPQVVMDFKSGVTFDPQPALQQGELDVVLTSDILPRSGLFYAPMFDFEVRLVLAPDHRLAQLAHITPEDLADEVLMIYPVQRQRLDVWRNFLQPAGVSPALKSVDNTLLLIQMVSAGMGIAALPHWVVESFEHQGTGGDTHAGRRIVEPFIRGDARRRAAAAGAGGLCALCPSARLRAPALRARCLAPRFTAAGLALMPRAANVARAVIPALPAL
jgi:Transcriptional regulator